MINKKNLWFLTLFSMILILSVYYITMPSELLLSNKTEDKLKETIKVEESELLTTLRVKSDEELDQELSKLKEVLNNTSSSAEDKNKAFEKIKELNETKELESELEKSILDNYKLKSFIKIKNNEIKVTINSNKHDTTLANNIMRKIQENFNEHKNIIVYFEK